MTNLYFTFAALPPRNDGTHVVHMYVRQGEPTRTDNPGDERRAGRDTKQIVTDICTVRNCDPRNEERLLWEGEMPPEAEPVFVFAIGVCWDREAKSATYKKLGFASVYTDPKFTKVAPTGAELFDYTFGVLKGREKETRAALHLPRFKFDPITLASARERFDEYVATCGDAHKAWIVNGLRFKCPNLRNGYCTPSNPKCHCYHNGRCEEMTAAKIAEKRSAK